MENPTHSFRETNLVLQLIWESQINSKTVISWSSWKKKESIFLPVIWSEGIYVLSQCILYWIHFQNIHTFMYQKTLLHKLSYLLLKLSKAFRVFLNKVLVWFQLYLVKKCDYFDDYDYDQWCKNSGVYCYKIWLLKPNKK